MAPPSGSIGVEGAGSRDGDDPAQGMISRQRTWGNLSGTPPNSVIPDGLKGRAGTQNGVRWTLGPRFSLRAQAYGRDDGGNL